MQINDHVLPPLRFKGFCIFSSMGEGGGVLRNENVRLDRESEDPSNICSKNCE